MKTKVGRFLRFVVQRRLQLLNTGGVVRSYNPSVFVASCVSFQLRPLPSTGITGFVNREPSVTPYGPACLSRVAS